MKYSILVIVIFVTATFVSCSNSREKMSGEISKMESDMKSSQKVDSVVVNELVSAYQNYSSKYPDDSLSSEYLYKAAGLAADFNHGVQAIDIYKTLIQTYPHYKKIPECYFMVAFTYENTLGNIGKANEFYTKFLDKYPDHELADDARAAIKFLGKSPEEMVREFEKMSTDSVK
jgi:outer membrane protein assembly factor BamD (BamD/ComL family)